MLEMSEQGEETAEPLDVIGNAAPYLVSKILGIYVGKDSKRYYRVKWQDSWEPEEVLAQSCQKLLDEFWAKFTFGPSNMQSGTHLHIKAENELQSPTSTEPNLAVSDHPVDGDRVTTPTQNVHVPGQGLHSSPGQSLPEAPVVSASTPCQVTPSSHADGIHLSVNSTSSGSIELATGPVIRKDVGDANQSPSSAACSRKEAAVIKTSEVRDDCGYACEESVLKSTVGGVVGSSGGSYAQHERDSDEASIQTERWAHGLAGVRELKSQNVASPNQKADAAEKSSKKRLHFPDSSGVAPLRAACEGSQFDVSTATQMDCLAVPKKPSFADNAQCPNVRTYNVVRSPDGFDSMSGRNYSAENELSRVKSRIAKLASSGAPDSDTLVSSSRMPAASSMEANGLATRFTRFQNAGERSASSEDDRSSVATAEITPEFQDYQSATAFADDEGHELELDIHGDFDLLNEGLAHSKPDLVAQPIDAQEQMAWSDPEGDHPGYWRRKRKDVIEIESEDEVEITNAFVSPSRPSKPGGPLGRPAGHATSRKGDHRPTRNQMIGLRSQVNSIPHYVSPGRARNAAVKSRSERLASASSKHVFPLTQRSSGLSEGSRSDTRGVVQEATDNLQSSPNKIRCLPQHPRARLPASSPSAAVALHPRNRLHRNGQVVPGNSGGVGVTRHIDRIVGSSVVSDQAVGRLNMQTSDYGASSSLVSPSKHESSKEIAAPASWPLSPSSTAAVLDGHRCKLCNVEFQNITLARQHAKKMHLFPSQDRGLTCEVCQGMFPNRNALRSHMLLHTENTLHVCEVCQRAFKTKQSLATHVLTHTEELPFACEICGKRFRQRPHLVLHMGTHGRNEESSFSCPECGVNFTREDEFSQHMREHDAHLPFVCNLCQERFPTRPDLLAHLEGHNEGRPYTCPICKKSFKTKTYLCGHVQMHKMSGRSGGSDQSDAVGEERKQVLVKSQAGEM